MDERIAHLIEALTSDDDDTRAAQLAELSDDELTQLESDLRDASNAYRGREPGDYTDEDVATLQSLRDAYQVVRTERDVRNTAAAARAEAAGSALADFDTDEPVADDESADETVAVDVDAAAGNEPTPEPPSAVESEPVAASATDEPVKAKRPSVRRPSLSELAATRPAQPEPVSVITDVRPRWQELNGSPLMDQTEIAERINAAREALVSAPAGFQDKVTVARLQARYPSDLTLNSGDDIVANMAKVNALTEDARNGNLNDEQQAIVAAGGWCAPRQPSYDIYSMVSADRPIANGLPSLNVTRGGVTLVRAGRLSSIVTGGPGTSNAAISMWTAAIDSSPGGQTKQRQTFGCRTPINEDLDAIVARGKFGNFQGRAFPELVADDVALMMAAHARVAERELLDKLIADVDLDVAQTGFFGTARDVKNHSLQVAADIRYVERSNAQVQAIFARELLPAIVHDVVAQTASGETSALEVDEGWARSFVNSIPNVSAIFAMDTSTGPETFQLATDGANLPDFPDTYEIPYFPAGSVVFLDGGRLDLGIVRDSTLNNTNDYELFVETFEGLAWLGGYAMTLTLTTCPNGKSQAASDVSTVCSGS